MKYLVDFFAGVFGALIATPVFLLWFCLLLPLALRPFGMALPAGFNRKQWMQEIAGMGSFRRVVVVGVMGYGVFLLLAISGSDCLRERYFGRDFHFSWDNLAISVISGILIAAVGADHA
ncbi:MAG: hypothetical protein WBW36_15810 [Candidatus Sulfotelmatobacter sp.]